MFGSLALAVAGLTFGHPPAVEGDPGPRVEFYKGGFAMPDGPWPGWGFPDGHPDGYGWYDTSYFLPLTPNRTPEYYFPRWYAVPGRQAFMPSYYNPYATRGQRYIPHNGAAGVRLDPAEPHLTGIGSGPRVSTPSYSGRTDARPVDQDYKTILP